MQSDVDKFTFGPIQCHHTKHSSFSRLKKCILGKQHLCDHSSEIKGLCLMKLSCVMLTSEQCSNMNGEFCDLAMGIKKYNHFKELKCFAPLFLHFQSTTQKYTKQSKQFPCMPLELAKTIKRYLTIGLGATAQKCQVFTLEIATSIIYTVNIISEKALES